MSRSDVLAPRDPHPVLYQSKNGRETAEGKITAVQAHCAYEAGAYPGSPVGGGMGVMFAPYRIENALVDGYDVLVNKPRTAAYRAPGGIERGVCL